MYISIIEKFTWNFLGVVIESMPFIVIGSIISAIIQIFISEELIKRFIPKISILGYLGVVLSGILFPICECAIVPITRSLIKKGLPVGIGVSFMLAVPIVNPIVIMSTYYAFPNNISILLLRTIGGAGIALIVGIIMGYIYKGKENGQIFKKNIITIRCECCIRNSKVTTSRSQKMINLINHGSNEFLNISVYFIVGAFVSSIFTTMVNNELLAKINPNNITGILLMMTLSFLLSLCSEADAFIAKGFLQNFGTGGIIAFLILGPMMDLKNAFLTFGVFENKFVMRLILMITASVTSLSLLISIV